MKIFIFNFYLFVPTNAHTYTLQYQITLQTLLHVSALLRHLPFVY